MGNSSNIAVAQLYYALACEVEKLNSIQPMIVSIDEHTKEILHCSANGAEVVDVGKELIGLITSVSNSVDAFIKYRDDFRIPLLILPAVGKLFDEVLSGKLYGPDDLHRIFEDEDFAVRQKHWMFQGLHTILCVYQQEIAKLSSGEILNDDPTYVFFIRTFLNLFKKVKIQCPEQTVHDAVLDFVKIECDLRAPFGTWDHDTWVPTNFPLGMS
jgi:hypothetical protein